MLSSCTLQVVWLGIFSETFMTSSGVPYYASHALSASIPYLAGMLVSAEASATVHSTGDDQEETGWKYIHGDVFRFPQHLSLFCACVGTGTQILTMAVCIFALALVGVFYPYNRGALLTACVVSP